MLHLHQKPYASSFDLVLYLARLLFHLSYSASDSDLPLYITLELTSVSLKPDLIPNPSHLAPSPFGLRTGLAPGSRE